MRNPGQPFGWPQACLCHACRRRAAGCPPISGYSVLANVDHGGLDHFGVASSVMEAAAVCSSDSRCQGFNSGGWMKTVATPTNYVVGMCLYAKKPVLTSECCQYASCVGHPSAGQPRMGRGACSIVRGRRSGGC